MRDVGCPILFSVVSPTGETMPGTQGGLNAYCLRGWMNGWMDARKGVYLKLFYSLNSQKQLKPFKNGNRRYIYIGIYSIRQMSPEEWQLTDSHA